MMSSRNGCGIWNRADRDLIGLDLVQLSDDERTAPWRLIGRQPVRESGLTGWHTLPDGAGAELTRGEKKRADAHLVVDKLHDR